MFPFNALFRSLRQNHKRRSAIRDLAHLSPQQLADIGLPADGLGEVVDAMLAKPEPFDLSTRFKPEIELRSLLPRPGYAGRPVY